METTADLVVAIIRFLVDALAAMIALVVLGRLAGHSKPSSRALAAVLSFIQRLGALLERVFRRLLYAMAVTARDIWRFLSWLGRGLRPLFKGSAKAAEGSAGIVATIGRFILREWHAYGRLARQAGNAAGKFLGALTELTLRPWRWMGSILERAGRTLSRSVGRAVRWLVVQLAALARRFCRALRPVGKLLELLALGFAKLIVLLFKGILLLASLLRSVADILAQGITGFWRILVRLLRALARPIATAARFFRRLFSSVGQGAQSSASFAGRGLRRLLSPLVWAGSLLSAALRAAGPLIGKAITALLELIKKLMISLVRLTGGLARTLWIGWTWSARQLHFVLGFPARLAVLILRAAAAPFHFAVGMLGRTGRGARVLVIRGFQRLIEPRMAIGLRLLRAALHPLGRGLGQLAHFALHILSWCARPLTWSVEKTRQAFRSLEKRAASVIGDRSARALFRIVPAAAALALLFGAGEYFDRRSHVVILMLTSDTKAEWVETVTETFNYIEYKTDSGKIIVVEVMEQDAPAEAQQAVLGGTIQPVVWSPGDMSWIEGANRISSERGHGVLVSEECPRVAYAATGFAMWLPMAEALGWPDTPLGWDDLLALATDPRGWGKYGRPEWGQFKFGHTHPEHSTTGFSVLASLAYASLDMTKGLTPELVNSEAVQEAFRTVELNTFHYGTSTRVLMNQMAERGPAYLHAVSASETAVLANNKYVPAPEDKLYPYVFIFPNEGTFWSDNPFCIMNTERVSEEAREAALIYRDYLLAPEQQEIAIDIGLRPAQPGVPLRAPISLDFYTDPRVSPSTVPPLQGVAGETAAAVIDLFNQTKRKATIILALDTSSSMRGSKIRTARAGLITFLRQLDQDDEVMAYLFDDRVRMIQSLDKAGSAVDGLIRQIEFLRIPLLSRTSLYDAVCEAKAAGEAAKAADEARGEKRLYGIVLLSDGEDTISAITEDQMYQECLPPSESADVVKIFTIAYGEDAVDTLLEGISARTNGRAFVADPENIEEVYQAISYEQ